MDFFVYQLLLSSNSGTWGSRFTGSVTLTRGGHIITQYDGGASQLEENIEKALLRVMSPGIRIVSIMSPREGIVLVVTARG